MIFRITLWRRENLGWVSPPPTKVEAESFVGALEVVEDVDAWDQIKIEKMFNQGTVRDNTKLPNDEDSAVGGLAELLA